MVRFFFGRRKHTQKACSMFNLPNPSCPPQQKSPESFETPAARNKTTSKTAHSVDLSCLRCCYGHCLAPLLPPGPCDADQPTIFQQVHAISLLHGAISADHPRIAMVNPNTRLLWMRRRDKQFGKAHKMLSSCPAWTCSTVPVLMPRALLAAGRFFSVRVLSAMLSTASPETLERNSGLVRRARVRRKPYCLQRCGHYGV
jgi:hypothetical protein